MRFSPLRSSAAWTLIDQCIVSLGNFGVTLLLARRLSPEEYGLYSLLLLTMLGLQTVSSSLLFYPLAVRGTVMTAEDRAVLFGRGLALLGLLCVPLAIPVAVASIVLGRADLIAPAVAWLVLWQVQELLRRNLLSDMRHAAAVPGDTLSYLGQAAGIFALSALGRLSLADSLLVMAATSGLAAMVQAAQAPIRLTIAGTRQTVRQCWRIGSFSLGSNLLSAVRAQVLPWTLAAMGGTIFAAQFQAAQNLVLAANPVLLGLCNVIPQMAARGLKAGGAIQAWHAARQYMVLGAIPLLMYYALLLAWPEQALRLLYGTASPYANLTLAVQLMAIAAIVGYGAEMVCSYLHGLQEAHTAMRINMFGLAACAAVGLPMTLAWGMTGSCIGLCAAIVVRSVAALQILVHMLGDRRQRYA